MLPHIRPARLQCGTARGESTLQQRRAWRGVPLRDGVSHQLAPSSEGEAAMHAAVAGRPAKSIPGRGALQVAHTRAASASRQSGSSVVFKYTSSVPAVATTGRASADAGWLPTPMRFGHRAGRGAARRACAEERLSAATGRVPGGKRCPIEFPSRPRLPSERASVPRSLGQRREAGDGVGEGHHHTAVGHRVQANAARTEAGV